MIVKKALYIYGAGGWSKKVINATEVMNEYEIKGIIDDSPSLKGMLIMGYSVLGGKEYLEHINKQNTYFIVAIGNNKIRRQLAENLLSRDFELATIIHTTAIIASNSTIGKGTVVQAAANIDPAVVIGKYCIINTGSFVGHDSAIGDAVHLSPGAHVGAYLRVGDRSWMGMNSLVISNKNIGEDCIIGAGSIVIDDIPSNSKVVGNPARKYLR